MSTNSTKEPPNTNAAPASDQYQLAAPADDNTSLPKWTASLYAFEHLQPHRHPHSGTTCHYVDPCFCTLCPLERGYANHGKYGVNKPKSAERSVQNSSNLYHVTLKLIAMVPGRGPSPKSRLNRPSERVPNTKTEAV